MIQRLGLIVLLLVAAPNRARAEPYDPPVAWSIAAGVATALVPLAIGGACLTSDSLSTKDAGTYVLMTGLALAPMVSHAVSREWKRMLYFGAVPVAAALGMVWLLQDQPLVLVEGNKDASRYVFGFLLAGSILGAAGGIVDSMWAGERAHAPRLTVAPWMGQGRFGLAIGGWL